MENFSIPETMKAMTLVAYDKLQLATVPVPKIEPHRNRTLHPCAAHCQEGKGRPVYHCPRKGGLRTHLPDHRRI